MKNLKNLGKTLNKNEQKSINGGIVSTTCPQVNPFDCISCGGAALPNGCCLGTRATFVCLNL